MPAVSYPYDDTGLAQSNKVTGETQVLTQINDDPFRFLIPTFAPFYHNNFVITGADTLGNIVEMNLGVDYNFCTPYIAASRANGSPISGALYIINKNIVGTVTLEYQCLGGAYSADRSQVVSTIAENNYNPRRCAWDQITSIQETFPPSSHPQPLDTFTGFRDLIDAIDRVVSTISTANPLSGPFYQHVLDTADPHETIAQIEPVYAKKTYVATAIANHVADPDPHPTYYNQQRLDAYLAANNLLTNSFNTPGF